MDNTECPCAEVRRSAALIADQAENVKLNELEINGLIKQIESKVIATGSMCFDKWEDWHLSKIKTYTLEQLTAYVFCVDAMNFCFWPDNTEGDFEYLNMTRNLEIILDKDPLFFTPARLVSVSGQ